MAQPKWTEERTAALVKFVGDESPVTQATVSEASEQLDGSTRSIASKLRKMGYDVEKVSDAARAKAFSDEQASTLATFVQDNSGEFTYAEIADKFPGDFSARAIQGKILSMELTSHVKAAPKKEYVRSYTAEEDTKFIELANSGSYLEDIAKALGRPVNSVRGKALSLLREERISGIPAQKNVVGKAADAFEGLDITTLTVEEIATQTGKTPRGVKTMLTRRGLTATDYDGAAKAGKIAAAAE